MNDSLETSLYVAGYHFGNESQLDRFLNQGIWQNGHEDLHIEAVNEVPKDSIIFLKTKSIKSKNELILKAVGRVTENLNNGHILNVHWKILPSEIDAKIPKLGGAYPGTFHKMRSQDFDLLKQAIGSDLFIKRFGSPMTIQLKELLLKEYTLVGDHEELLLESREIAKIYAKIIHRSSSQLISFSKSSQEDRFFGIFGRWGRGKTRLWNEIKNNLLEIEENQYEIIEFHAWKYQDTPSIWAFLYETFANKYYFKSKSWWPWGFIKTSFISSLQAILISFYRRPVYIFRATIGIIGSLICLIIWMFHPTLNFLLTENLEIRSIILGLSTLGSVILTLLGIEKSIHKPLLDQIESFSTLTDKINFRNHLGIQHEIQQELKHLFKAWNTFKQQTFVLFIDDIDRCIEGKIISIVDSLRVLLIDNEIQKNLIIIAAIDERILGNAIRNKYSSFLNKEDVKIRALVSEYIDKLFIAGIKLPKLSGKDKKEMISGLISDLVADDDNIQNKNGEDSTISSSNNSIETPDDEDFTKVHYQIDKTELDGQLTSREAEQLNEAINDLQEATPRSIRNYLYKYLIARDLIDALVQKSTINRVNWIEERNHYLNQLSIYLANLMSGDAYNFPESIGDPNMDSILKKVLEMVNYSHIQLANKGDN